MGAEDAVLMPCILAPRPARVGAEAAVLMLQLQPLAKLETPQLRGLGVHSRTQAQAQKLLTTGVILILDELSDSFAPAMRARTAFRCASSTSDGGTPPR